MKGEIKSRGELSVEGGSGVWEGRLMMDIYCIFLWKRLCII